MRPKSIGIVGGAGPLAGAYLLERIISCANTEYGCSRDADFPEVVSISYPFSDMLSPEIDEVQVKLELSQCLTRLKMNGASVFAIACNTLHAFLEKDIPDGLIQLPDVVAKMIPQGVVPIILCTSTSVRFHLHKRFFNCKYPELEIQLQVDHLIESILCGRDLASVAERLEKILEQVSAHYFILGCTELSLLSPYLNSSDRIFLDPIELIAKQVLEKSFLKVLQ